MNKTFLKWSPAVPIRKPDNIISSHAKACFTPSYENVSRPRTKRCVCVDPELINYIPGSAKLIELDPKENMNFLMSNEYMRIWFKERAGYEKDIYTREQIIKEESKIKRRIIQRMMTYRKPTKNHFIDENIQRKRDHNKKTDTKNQEKGQEKMKFKPQCPTKPQGGGTEGQIKVKSRSKHHVNNEATKIVKESEDSDECDNECEIILCPGEQTN